MTRQELSGLREALSVLDVSASGLAAQRLRMTLIANNIANANSLKSPKGGPYRRREALFASVMAEELLTSEDPVSALRGVKLLSVVEAAKPFKSVYNPDHPMADDKGFVLMPNISVAKEMVGMVTAARAYEANLSVLKAFREMTERTLAMLK